MQVKKPKEKIKTINLGGAIPYSIKVVLTDNVNSSRSGRSYFLGEWEEKPNTGAVHSGTDEGRSFIFLPYELHIDYIVHESYHAVVRILEYIGAGQDEEIIAYFLGYIVDQIVTFMLKQEEPCPQCTSCATASTPTKTLSMDPKSGS